MGGTVSPRIQTRHPGLEAEVKIQIKNNTFHFSDFSFLSTTTAVRNYWHNYEKRYCFGSHKQLKTLLREHMVKLKIVSLYI